MATQLRCFYAHIEPERSLGTFTGAENGVEYEKQGQTEIARPEFRKSSIISVLVSVGWLCLFLFMELIAIY